MPACILLGTPAKTLAYKYACPYHAFDIIKLLRPKSLCSNVSVTRMPRVTALGWASYGNDLHTVW